MLAPGAVFDAYVAITDLQTWAGVERLPGNLLHPLPTDRDLPDLLSDLTARGLTVLVGLCGDLCLPADPSQGRAAWRRMAGDGLARLAVGVADHPWLIAMTRVWPLDLLCKPLLKASDWRIVITQIPYRPTILMDLAQRDQAGLLSVAFAQTGPVLGHGPQRIDIHDWIKDPALIYEKSFATIQGEVDILSLPPDMQPVATRLIHACGMTDLMADLRWTDGAATRGRLALAAGAPILVDAEMVSHGIIRRNLPKSNPVICTLNDPVVGRTAKSLGTTRSAMATELWRPHLDGAVVAVGNAPTALFRLLEMVEEGAPPPALVLGFAVGFVGAAESKQALMESGLPHICIQGRRGGSAMAAAAVNALAKGLE